MSETPRTDKELVDSLISWCRERYKDRLGDMTYLAIVDQLVELTAAKEKIAEWQQRCDEREAERDNFLRSLEAAEAQIKALREALESCRQSHYNCEDSWYSCPLSSEGCADDRRTGCTCGADYYNAIIDAACKK